MEVWNKKGIIMYTKIQYKLETLIHLALLHPPCYYVSPLLLCKTVTGGTVTGGTFYAKFSYYYSCDAEEAS